MVYKPEDGGLVETNDDAARQLDRLCVGLSVDLVPRHLLPLLSETYTAGSQGGVSTVRQVGCGVSM